MRRAIVPRLLGPILAIASASCADAQFEAKFAPEFTPGPVTLSVFGVYRQGRMSPEAWSEIGPPLATALGAATCPVAFSEALHTQDPDLYAHVDEQSRADGLTDDLIDGFAPLAEGEVILSISVRGKVQPVSKSMGDAAAATGAPSQPARGASRGRHAPGAGPSRSTGPALEDLRIAATLYSVKLRRSVGRVTMSYTGTSATDAVASFAKAIDERLPGSTCVGWRAKAPPGTATPAAAPRPPPPAAADD